MPTFMINPMPTMISQTFFNIPLLWGYHIPIIDPTCGRYCLKALLKHFYEKHLRYCPSDVELPKPTSCMGGLYGYDPFDDFRHRDDMLKETDNIPATIDAWILMLQTWGPVILRGKLGHATMVSHFILLVGAKSEGATKEFYYKDPLVGDALQTEAFATMQGKIEAPLVRGSSTIMTHLQKIRVTDVNGLAFQNVN